MQPQIILAKQQPCSVLVTHYDPLGTGPGGHWPISTAYGRFANVLEAEQAMKSAKKYIRRMAPLLRLTHRAAELVRQLPSAGLAIKFVANDGDAPYVSSFKWPLPSHVSRDVPWLPDEWVKCDGALVPCENGLHACPISQAQHYYHMHFLGKDVVAYLAEYRGGAMATGYDYGADKLVAREMRLLWPLFTPTNHCAGAQVRHVAGLLAALHAQVSILASINTLAAREGALRREVADAAEHARQALYALLALDGLSYALLEEEPWGERAYPPLIV